jgi:hypothetical protein
VVRGPHGGAREEEGHEGKGQDGERQEPDGVAVDQSLVHVLKGLEVLAAASRRDGMMIMMMVMMMRTMIIAMPPTEQLGAVSTFHCFPSGTHCFSQSR